MNLRMSALALALCIAGVADAEDERKDEGVFQPGVQHVCVPAAGGDGWDCGTETAPPRNYQPLEPQSEAEIAPDAAAEAEPEVQSEAESEEAPAPPFFLADPMRRTPYAPIEKPSREPATAAEAVVAAEAADPATEPAPAMETAPVEAVAPAAPTPVVQDGLDASISAEAGRAALVSGPSAAALPLGDASAFARLPATAFTLQLAYAATNSEFARLVADLGLDPASCYVLRVRGTNGPTWLLAHGAFAGASAARAAQAALPKVAGLSAQWPRRIGALQTEITQGL